MADTEKQRAATYRRDLQRLIAISFSAGELSKYAERWRVFTDREGASEGGARALVRAMSGRGKLSALVESLRSHKPLVEWPDPPPEPTIPQGPLDPAGSHPAGSHPADSHPDGSRPGADGQSPSQRSRVGGVASTLIDEPSGDDDISSEPSAASRPDRGAPLIDPYLDAARATRPPAVSIAGISLPSIATGLAGIAVGATAMYLVHPERKTTQTMPVAIAQLASDHLRDRVGAVAEACQVPTDGDSARDVLGLAFAECGVPEISDRRRHMTAPQFNPTPSPPPPPQRPPPTRRRPGSKSPSGAGCLDGCQDTYTSCAKTKCGAEPQSAADNASWSRCLNECQSTRMRCRLACR